MSENRETTTITEQPTVYTTSWCPFCSQLKSGLDAIGVEYSEIDVEADAEAAAFVESVNDGNRVVPTVRYSDGSTATNPPADDVASRLRELDG